MELNKEALNGFLSMSPFLSRFIVGFFSLLLMKNKNFLNMILEQDLRGAVDASEYCSRGNGLHAVHDSQQQDSIRDGQGQAV